MAKCARMVREREWREEGGVLLTSGYKSLLTSHHRKVIMAMLRSLTSALNPSQTCMYLVEVHWYNRIGWTYTRSVRRHCPKTDRRPPAPPEDRKRPM